ncbi:hypothetical protein OA953_00470 [Gammaproteobacteria bacterium]|nr:hypothetical protein [Gammaproteobacteria bacterium]
MKIVLIFLTIMLLVTDVNSENNEIIIEEGQTWALEKRSTKFSPTNSKVLYYFSIDALNTYQARKFNDWDQFSIVDGRNLVRLNKGDRIKIIKSKHQDEIYEVELLDGFEKNKKYFVIKEDLFSDFALTET